jgi:hypothetical protein
VRRCAVLEHADQLVLRAIEGALPGIALVPDQEVLPLAVARAGGGQQLGEMAPIDKQEMDRSIGAEGDGVADKARQEGGEGLLAHLARSHREFAVTGLAAADGVPLDRHVVGWIGDHHLRELALQQRPVGGLAQGVAADQTMPPEFPDVAGPTNGWAFLKPRQIVGRIGCCRRRLAVQHQVDLAGREAGQLDLEVEVDQLLEVLAQQIEVPDRLFRQPVVGDDNGSLLGGAETGDGQRWDLAAPEPLGRLQPRMAGKDRAGLVDQDRVGPNPLDALHQPGDLILGMASRVSREGLQITDRDPADFIHQPPRRSRVRDMPWCRGAGRRNRWRVCNMLTGAAAGERRVVAVLHVRMPCSQEPGRLPASSGSLWMRLPAMRPATADSRMRAAD